MPPEATTASPLTAEQLAMQATPVAVPEHHPTPPANGSPAETPTPTDTRPDQATPTEQPKPKGTMQHELVQSGSKDVQVGPDKDTQNKVAEKVIKRKQIAEKLKGEDRQLTTVDRLLLQMTPEAIARLESGTLTREDMALCWFVLHDEILQKSLAAAKLVRDVPGRYDRLKNIPLIGHLARGPQTQLVDIEKRLTTEYTREINFADSKNIEQHLTELNQLRLNFEQSLFARGFRDPLFDQVSTSIYPSEFNRGSRLRLHNEVTNQLKGVLEQNYNGRTYLDLEQQDPVAAIQALFEANQRALTSFSAEAGRALLTAEKPVTDFEAIENHAAKLEEKPRQEEVTRLREAATAAKTTTGEAEAKVSALRAQLETAEQTVRDRGAAQKKSLYREEAAKNSFGGKIPGLETRLTQLSHELATLDPAIKGKDRASVIQELSRNITKIEEVLKGYREAILTATEKRIDADVDMESAQNHLDRLKDDSARKREVQEAERELARKARAQRAAEKDYKDRREDFEKGGTQEKRDQAKALRRWAEAARNFETIVDKRFSRDREDEFTRDRLASTAETPDGQAVGAERIRQHVLGLFDKAGYDPVLARKMVSDEAIARAIINIYQLDINRLDSTNTTLTQRIENIKSSLDDLARDNAAKALLKATLPYLRASQFQVGDLMRFLVHEGIKSAENGNPYIQIGEDFLKTQPALKLEAESILRPGTGHAEITDRAVTWDGEVQNSGPRGVNEGDLPFHYRVTTNLNRQGANYEVQVETNLNLLQSLPDTVRRGEVEESIWGTFYDGEGHLRTEIRGIDRRELARMIRERRFIDPRINIPQWIPITGERVENVPPPRTVLPPVTTPTRTLAADRVWANIDSVISPDASDAMAASIANNILQRSPQERLQLLRGGLTPIEVPEVPVTGTTDTEHLNANYRVEFDNGGNIYITNTNTQEKSELNAFYQRRLETYRQSLGIHTLNPDERKKLHDEFLIIQSELGREILRAQQRR